MRTIEGIKFFITNMLKILKIISIKVIHWNKNIELCDAPQPINFFWKILPLE
jgi:hypothetical protein